MRVERHAHRHGHGSTIAASVDKISDPWNNTTLSRVFLFRNQSRQLDALFRRQRQALAERIATIGVVQARQLFAALRTAGMESEILGEWDLALTAPSSYLRKNFRMRMLNWSSASVDIAVGAEWVLELKAPIKESSRGADPVGATHLPTVDLMSLVVS